MIVHLFTADGPKKPVRRVNLVTVAAVHSPKAAVVTKKQVPLPTAKVSTPNIDRLPACEKFPSAVRHSVDHPLYQSRRNSDCDEEIVSSINGNYVNLRHF